MFLKGSCGWVSKEYVFESMVEAAIESFKHIEAAGWYPLLTLTLDPALSSQGMFQPNPFLGPEPFAHF